MDHTFNILDNTYKKFTIFNKTTLKYLNRHYDMYKNNFFYLDNYVFCMYSNVDYFCWDFIWDEHWWQVDEALYKIFILSYFYF